VNDDGVGSQVIRGVALFTVYPADPTTLLEWLEDAAMAFTVSVVETGIVIGLE
jgi:hypothetical protein